MKPLTKKQQAVYDYLIECSDQGKIPSVREICRDVGLKSTSTAHLYLKALEEHGLIEREAGLNRCIKVVGETSAKSVPILGDVAAGNPIVAIEDVLGYVTVDKNLSRGKELFALKVQGESMINAGILPDDILIVHRTPVAENGEIVVALVDDSATVKRFYKEDGHFRLQPENDYLDPILVRDCTILGKVIGLFRTIH